MAQNSVTASSCRNAAPRSTASLAPMPHRGKTNEPGFVAHVGEYIAKLKGLPVEQVAAQTTANFFKLFNVLAH